MLGAADLAARYAAFAAIATGVNVAVPNISLARSTPVPPSLLW